MALIELTTEMTEQEERAAQNSNNLYQESELDAKAPLNSPALTGTPTSTTPAAGDNSTKIATTAFVHTLMNYMTPIGYHFEWSPVKDKPIDLSTAQKVHDYYGFGTWALLGIGRTTVCIDTSDPHFDTAGKTYGEKTHTLTYDEMPAHTHNYPAGNAGAGSYYQGSSQTISNRDANIPTTPAGGGQPHNNIQPSVAVYRWQRIA